MKPLKIITPTKAKNQRQALRGSSNSNAPNGQMNDHKTTALELMNPPSADINKNGRRRMSNNWLKRKNRYCLVTANVKTLKVEKME